MGGTSKSVHKAFRSETNSRVPHPSRFLQRLGYYCWSMKPLA
jgi:hypothetical protein